MPESRFNFYNNVVGWIVFAVAAFTYLSTIEPTTSLWDCGEFIAASYKLQVVHPPGAPFFLLLNRFFTIFAPDPTWVPKLVNGSSAMASAFAILFLFWSITALARKLIIKDLNNVVSGELIAVLGSGAIGALAFTFTDSFWFSAVEGEVYALSAFFMALVFWLMLKWEKRADQPHNLRWLVLITYLVGLSIGVHLLSLLVIPSLALIYYLRFYKATWKGLGLALLGGLVVLFFFNTVVIRWIPAIAAEFELLFVNSLGLPFWSGIFFFMILLAALLIYGIYWTHQKQKYIVNLILVSMTTILIGYSSYAMVVIRSAANPPIDMNDPETVFSLISYLNREQYGDRPLAYGPYFTAEMVDVEDGDMQYRKGENKYLDAGPKRIPKYDPQHMTIFPRMGDNTRQDRMEYYREWENIPQGTKPRFSQNMHFFFTYQLGHMYWRYFAWNFIGRQNGEQGFGHEFNKGNWMSGIGFLDEIFTDVGPQENLPHDLRVDKSRNHLYFLPFLLGILGLIWHYKKDKESLLYVAFFFLMTGFALIIYSNQPPIEPRERDYVLVGSFFAFSIWIGMGVLQIREWLLGKLSPQVSSAIAFVVCLVVPAIMVAAEWDDHDRSNRYMPKSLAINYLESCPENAILFTNGDNETYPVWYAQEVEGIRSDVRSVNLSLLNTSWYVDNLRLPANNAEGLPFSLGPEKIIQGTRDQIVFREQPEMIDPNKHYNLKEIIEFIGSDNQRTKLGLGGGQFLNYFPTKKFYVPVDKDKVIKSGLVDEKYRNRIEDRVEFKFNKNNMMKADLMVLDLLSNSDWERPLCFAITSGKGSYLGMHKYFRLDGMVYTMTPVREPDDDPDQQTGWINPDRLYDHVMNKFEWGNLAEEEVFVDNVMLRQLQNYRNVFNRTAGALLNAGDKERAKEVLDKCMTVLPERNVPYGFLMLPVVQSYYAAGDTANGQKYGKRLNEVFVEQLDYYFDLDSDNLSQVEQEIQRNFYGMRNIQQAARQSGQTEFADEIQSEMERLQQEYYATGGGRQQQRRR